MYGGVTMPISINSILQVKPRTWSNESYTGKLYVTVELESYSDEYEQIEEELRRKGIHKTISKIERIQHPFAYGRFLLRKQQLEKRNGYATEPTRTFYIVSSTQLQETIEYNMDNRRTSINSLSLYSLLGNSCVVAVQQLNHNKERDSEQYPEYIIYFD